MTPIWRPSGAPSTFPPLDRDLVVDVVVIGAGITGLTVAWRLGEAGLSVAVLDLGTIGAGATGHSTGHLTAALDVGWDKIVRRFGEEGASEVAARSVEAIRVIEEMAARYGIECGFRRVDGWRYTEATDALASFEAERDAARELGLDVEVLGSGPLPFMRHCLRFRGQAMFDPVAYLTGLARAISSPTCHIFENSRVESVVEGEPCQVEVGPFTVTATSVVHASHTPIGVVLPLQARIAPYMSHVIGARIEGPMPPDLYWDTAEPYHYLRSARGPDGVEVLLVGGEDRKTGQDPDPIARYSALEAYTRARFPVTSVAWRWSSEVFEPVDGLPYIGRLGHHRHVYGATGFAGTGLTYGTVAGLVIAGLILGDDTDSVFRPQRYKPWVSARSFLKENANVVWHAVRDRMVAPDGRTADQVLPGEGLIVQIGGRKAAVYRSSEGDLRVLDPVCPHAGGIVQWNAAARSWDCPLHGSRFHPDGQVLAGPACNDLAPFEDSHPAESAPAEATSSRSAVSAE